ncbi:MAG: hypothetical protein WCI51_13465 [Lentisphaerota bacterium]
MLKGFLIAGLTAMLSFHTYSEDSDIWGKNLLKNNDFNEGKTGWSAPGWIKKNTDFTVVENNAAKSLKMSITAANEQSMVSQTITLNTSVTDFRIMFDAKYHLPNSFFYVKMDFKDAQNKSLKMIVLLTIYGKSEIYKTFSKEFSLPAKTKFINLFLHLEPQKIINENANIEISSIYLQPKAE